MPTLTGVLETSLYVEDVPRSADFYRGLFGFDVLFTDARTCALSVAGRQIMLLFRKGASTAPMPTSGGVLPPHDGSGRLHLAFAIAAAELPAWEEHLRQHGVTVESRVTWPLGGHSIYFRDPDGHLLELATPGTWRIY
jgi:catechol 2,3-dioxygenase-like lactoylglutathione lyase family enzyme